MGHPVGFSCDFHVYSNDNKNKQISASSQSERASYIQTNRYEKFYFGLRKMVKYSDKIFFVLLVVVFCNVQRFQVRGQVIHI